MRKNDVLSRIVLVLGSGCRRPPARGPRGWLQVGVVAVGLLVSGGPFHPVRACVMCSGCDCVPTVGDGAYLCNVKKERSHLNCGFLKRFLGLCEGDSSTCECHTEEPCHADKKLTPEIRGDSDTGDSSAGWNDRELTPEIRG